MPRDTRREPETSVDRLHMQGVKEFYSPLECALACIIVGAVGSLLREVGSVPPDSPGSRIEKRWETRAIAGGAREVGIGGVMGIGWNGRDVGERGEKLGMREQSSRRGEEETRDGQVEER